MHVYGLLDAPVDLTPTRTGQGSDGYHIWYWRQKKSPCPSLKLGPDPSVTAVTNLHDSRPRKGFTHPL